jgi:hypothetical protein
MNIKILNKNIPFSKAARFSKKLTSPAGLIFSASTEKGEPTIKISPKGLRGSRIREHIMRIPLNKKSYAIQIGAVIPGPRSTAIIGGPRRKKTGHLIVIGGPRPDMEVIGGPRRTSEPLFVELDATKGNWHIEPDFNADVLNISFGGPKIEE